MGSSSLIICNRFAMTSPLMLVAPVMLPPGLARLATSPIATGSKVPTNTTGIYPQRPWQVELKAFQRRR